MARVQEEECGERAGPEKVDEGNGARIRRAAYEHLISIF